jgi:hypothetical protein
MVMTMQQTIINMISNLPRKNDEHHQDLAAPFNLMNNKKRIPEEIPTFFIKLLIIVLMRVLRERKNKTNL